MNNCKATNSAASLIMIQKPQINYAGNSINNINHINNNNNNINGGNNGNSISPKPNNWQN